MIASANRDRAQVTARLTQVTTRLEGPLKRELTINGTPYTVIISPEGLKLVQKGRRKGYELDWNAFVSGEAAFAAALNASLAAAPETKSAPPKETRTAARRRPGG